MCKIDKRSIFFTDTGNHQQLVKQICFTCKMSNGVGMIRNRYNQSSITLKTNWFYVHEGGKLSIHVLKIDLP